MFIWYVLALVVSLVVTCYFDKVHHGEVTVGDFIFNVVISMLPGVNFAFAIFFTVMALFERSRRADLSWLRKKMF